MSNLAATPELESLPGHALELGGLAIRRLLPRRQRRLVGAWCFLDCFGPISFAEGKPMDVPPHPHIGLQTVSWLLEGEVSHKDSLGLAGLARPGVVNVMTAGRGIAHSEETPPANGGRLRGVQLWVALPDRHRASDPAFHQIGELPQVRLASAKAVVFMGTLGGVRSPAPAFSPLVGADLEATGAGLSVVPLDPDFEHALVPLEGEWRTGGTPLAVETLHYLGPGRRELALQAASAGARALLLGGLPFDEPVLMWWNFVARTSDEIAAAREDWAAGRRFGAVKAYAGPRLEAPPYTGRVSGAGSGTERNRK
jgi:redox-sensitive bicupin YhaK (pirin superfamily)